VVRTTNVARVTNVESDHLDQNVAAKTTESNRLGRYDVRRINVVKNVVTDLVQSAVKTEDVHPVVTTAVRRIVASPVLKKTSAKPSPPFKGTAGARPQVSHPAVTSENV
jgi:hypothetical protein